MRARSAVLILALFAFVFATPNMQATFGGVTSTSTAFTADALAPPTNFTATTRCSLVLVRPVADLSWTATSSSWANGYRIQRWRGATLETTIIIGSPATTTYTDGGLTSTLLTGTTYTWRIVTTRASWTSTTVIASATTPPICL